MKVYNLLPEFSQCLRAWEKPPSLREFSRYYDVAAPLIGPMLKDWGMTEAADFHAEALSVNWKVYRDATLALDPVREEARARSHIVNVERLLGIELGGEIVLFGAFGMMDGYARFDGGRHRVFLGVDESHGRGRYLDILVSHEITHVAREGQASVWAGFGLPPDLSHDEFTDKLPVIEHLFNEGFSCCVSERVAPCDEPWHYAYQERDGLAFVYEHAPALDRVIHAELRKGADGDYGHLYDPSRYHARMPPYCHYVWAWKWVDRMIREHGDGDPAKLLGRCSAEFLEDALRFELKP